MSYGREAYGGSLYGASVEEKLARADFIRVRVTYKELITSARLDLVKVTVVYRQLAGQEFGQAALAATATTEVAGVIVYSGAASLAAVASITSSAILEIRSSTALTGSTSLSAQLPGVGGWFSGGWSAGVLPLRA